MKTVAIVGAGPAGLIAARKLLQSQHFTVTIFEKGTQVGGSWAPDSIINPEMRTNQSKFIMSYSDLSWESVQLPDGQQAPVYPKASQVMQYIETYYERFILSHNVVQFRTKVESVEQCAGEDGSPELKWKLRLEKDTGNGDVRTTEAIYDHVVMAPGIYSVPKSFPDELRKEALRDSQVPIIHSTEYRTLDQLKLSAEGQSQKKRKVLVVGGSHSGGMIASLVALQISDAQYSPSASDESRRTWKDVEVLHVSSHEMFALPEFTRDSGASSCTFQPVDFTLFNRSSRPADPPPSFTVGLVTPQKVKALRKMVTTIVNGDEGRTMTGKGDELAPVGILDDMYLQFLKTGKIFQVRGTLKTLEAGDSTKLDAAIESTVGSGAKTVENVCAVIYAAGFDVPSALSILSDDTKAALGFDASCQPAPVILNDNFLTRNSALPSFAMIGFPGAFWGLFEMQARAIVQAWTHLDAKSDTDAQKEQKKTLDQYYQDLRTAVKEQRKPEVPQNPFGDGLGAMEQGSRDLRLDRFDLGFDEASGFVCSARYIDPGNDKLEAMKTLLAVQSIRTKARSEGLFLARAVFHGLAGDWVAAARNASGSVQFVQRSFHPRFSTDEVYDFEFLSVLQNGDEIRKEVYRYQEATDKISAWTTLNDGLTTDQLLGTFSFNHERQERGKDTVCAVFQDAEAEMQDQAPLAAYRFLFGGATVKTWTMGRLEADVEAKFELNFIRVGSE
jgi:hypothetical protein